MFPFNWDPQRVGTITKLFTELTEDQFPFNWDPQRVGTFWESQGVMDVMGFHSIGIPSEWGRQMLSDWQFIPGTVSIQLGSPASGDWAVVYLYRRSNSFPFNWDPQRVGTFLRTFTMTITISVSIQLGSPASGDDRKPDNAKKHPRGFHSIGIPSEWGLGMLIRNGQKKHGFHSIGIPSEWGQSMYVQNWFSNMLPVSIQLGSPASGDTGTVNGQEVKFHVSIQLGSPASGDRG